MPQALSIMVLQNPINCLVFESTLWFSQKAIAKIFGSTRQNISLHASDLGYDGTEAISKNFDIQQLLEGPKWTLKLQIQDIWIQTWVTKNSNYVKKIEENHPVE